MTTRQPILPQEFLISSGQLALPYTATTSHREEVTCHIFGGAIFNFYLSSGYAVCYEKYRNNNALDLFPNEDLPLVSRSMALLLSWYNIFFCRLYPCSFKNRCLHSNLPMKSSTATNSASVELRVFNFCLLLDKIIAPPANDNVKRPPDCDLKSSCTPKDASTCHLAMLKLSKCNTKCKSIVPFRY